MLVAHGDFVLVEFFEGGDFVVDVEEEVVGGLEGGGDLLGLQGGGGRGGGLGGRVVGEGGFGFGGAGFGEFGGGEELGFERRGGQREGGEGLHYN